MHFPTFGTLVYTSETPYSSLYCHTFMAYKNCEMTKNRKRSIKVSYSSYRYRHPWLYYIPAVQYHYYRQVFAELKWDFDRTGKHCLRCRHRLCTLSWYQKALKLKIPWEIITKVLLLIDFFVTILRLVPMLRCKYLNWSALSKDKLN